MIYKARVSVVVSRTYEFDLDVDEDDAEFDLDIRATVLFSAHGMQTKWIHENAKLIDASIEDVEILSIEEADNVDGL